MTTSMRHPERKVAHATLEGVEYKAHPDTGVIEVHDGHVAAARSLGFKTMDELEQHAIEVKQQAEQKATEPAGDKDQFEDMGFDDLGKWLLDNGVPVDDVKTANSKDKRRVAARARVAELAKAAEHKDPIES